MQSPLRMSGSAPDFTATSTRGRRSFRDFRIAETFLARGCSSSGCENVSGRVAEIGNLKSGGLQPVGDPGGAQCCGRALEPGAKGRGARGRAQQGNILRLTDDLDRQSRSPEIGDPLP